MEILLKRPLTDAGTLFANNPKTKDALNRSVFITRSNLNTFCKLSFNWKSCLFGYWLSHIIQFQMIPGLFLIETSLSLFFHLLFLQPVFVSSATRVSYPFRVGVCFPMEPDVNMTAHGNGIEWQIELRDGIMCQYGRCTQPCLCGHHWLVAPVSADSVSWTRMESACDIFCEYKPYAVQNG